MKLKKEDELNNIIEILNVKYNERDILLNKQEYDEELDKEIEDMEKEKKKLESMISNKKSKINVILKKKCIKELKCWNENCIYEHPDNWNPYDNKKECTFCHKGFCNKINNKYKHINNNDKNIIEEKENLKINRFENIMENEKELFKQPTIEININDKYINLDKNINSIDKIEDNNNLIDKMEEDIERHIEKIKVNIDNIEIKLHLNKILSEIRLFKYNYEDIIGLIN